jgi:hypothetical protein
MRSRAFNRDVSYRKAKRKQRIAKEVYYDGDKHPYYDNLHQYSKNKIHCSCPMCAAKTRNKKRRKNNGRGFAPSINYKPADWRRQSAMDENEKNPD